MIPGVAIPSRRRGDGFAAGVGCHLAVGDSLEIVVGKIGTRGRQRRLEAAATVLVGTQEWAVATG